MIVATAAQQLAPASSSCMYADIKPTVESTNVAVQRWTLSKQLIISPSKKMIIGAVKPEVCTAETRPSCSAFSFCGSIACDEKNEMVLQHVKK